ncbi:hypothetical protein LCGC14_0414890, partial [marine sediment metagenome]
GGGATGSTNRYDEIHFRKSNNEIAFRIQFKMLEGGWVSGDRGDVAYWNGAGWIEFADGEDLTWYRNRIDFDCTSGKYSWYIYDTDDSILGSITNIDFENPMTTLDEIFFTSHYSTYRGTTYFDAFGFTWEGYNIGDNRFDDAPGVLNFEIDSQLDSSSRDITSVSLDYSYNNTNNKQVSLKIFNYAQQNWDTVIDNSIYSSFTPQTYAITGDYYDQNYNLKFRFEGDTTNTSYEFYLDQFKINYNYIPTGGNINVDITKTISDSFLNLYDSGFSNYKNLFNITTEFDYRFAKNNSAFADFAQLSVDGNDFTLTKDGSWHSFKETIEFDSTSQNSFDFMFNISNGLLELEYMNYTIVFKSIDTSDHTLLGQNFNIEFNEEADLQALKNIIGVEFLLSTSYDFTPTQDGKIYYNSFGRTNLFEIIYKIKANGVWYNNSYYATNLGETKIEVFNITQFMRNNGLSFFQDFAIEFVVIGNSSELTVNSVFLNATTDTKYIQEYYRIIDNIMGTTSPWQVLNSSAVSVLDDLGELPDNFSIEYSVIDFAGNEGTNTTYTTNYQNIIFSREKTITLSDDAIDLNLGGSREISFANTGQFSNVSSLDAYINGFNYGTAYLDNSFYKLNFGTENSIDTLLGYSDSLISSNIGSNIDPLNHVSWEVREDDAYTAVKHVLVDGDIIINNPILDISYIAVPIGYLYENQFGLKDFVYMRNVYYYNTSGLENNQQFLSEDDYNVDEKGIISFPENSTVYNLYQNSTNIENDLIYFEYYHTGEVNGHLTLPNADGFFINFTMPSIYYDHTTIERLVISFNDVLGNMFSIIFYDIDLREYFLANVKDNYERSIFGLGQMMIIPLYISIEDIQLSNRNHKFEIELLESITFTISDSVRWPGSFIQQIENYSVMNLPYQRVGIQDLKLYNLIGDSIEIDENGFVNSTIEFRAPNYYNFYASNIFKIKRLNIEFTNLKIYSDSIEVSPGDAVDVEYSDFIELNYRWNNSVNQVLLGDIYKLPVTLNDVNSSKIISLGLSHWITKINYDSLSGYISKYYYSDFEVPKILESFNATFSSLGTPIFNISFVDTPTFILNVTQESLLPSNPIYLSNTDIEIEYGDPLRIDGVVRDNDQYLIRDEVYDYVYQEALDGQTVHHLKLISPFGEDTFISKTEFAIYYINNNLEKVPLYSTLNGKFYKDNAILKYGTNPEINYVDNAFLINIFWKKQATNFINYDTILLISYKMLRGEPISPLSYSTIDSLGHDQQDNLIEIPFARYDMLSRNWVTEDDFIEQFLVDSQLLYKDVQSIGTTIQGPKYNETQIIQTGIVDLDYIEVNKSYSNEFTIVNNSAYSWSINQNGELVVDSLNYSSGDVFRIWYFGYYPTKVYHPLNTSVSQISYLTIKNQTGFEYNLTLNQDYKLSDDGYSIYFLDLYNQVIKSNNFTMDDTFSIKYHSPLSRKVDLSSNILLNLQDTEGNDIPIDTIKINLLGFFEYNKPLRLKEPFEVETVLSLPLGGGKKIVHTSLAYMPSEVYNKSSDQFVNIDYVDNRGNYIYPYKESNKWIKSLTIKTIPNRVRLEIVQDITQDIVIDQNFIKEREYLFNLNPAEMIESGEEYTRVMIDALVKEEYEIKLKLLEYDSETDPGTPVNDSIVWLHLGIMPKSKTQFLNDRALIEEYNMVPYFESLGTEEITFKGPGTSANKMFGRPLTYELDTYNSNYSAYGPLIWTYGITNEFGEVSFNMTFDKEYLEMFMDIFGSVEGISSIEDISFYIRAFSSYFDWDEFIIDTPSQYLSSKDGIVFDGSYQIINYDFTELILQDSTYLEGVVNLHKKPVAIASNDYISYTLPDGDINTQFDPISIFLSGTEADIIPNGEFQTLESLTKQYKSSELEPTHKSIFSDEDSHRAIIDFINPSGNIIYSLEKLIRNSGENGYFTIGNETVKTIMNILVGDMGAGPGISSIQIQIAESEYYAASSSLSFPIEIKAANWLKFGEKNTEIDLLDPFINAYGSVFSGEDGTDIAPFESAYPHLIGTIWVEPDFLGLDDDKERSIQDYVEINLIASVLDEDGYETNFPLREGVMLRPGNRDGFMRLDVGLGPEDAFLMDLIVSLNLSFSIDFNGDEIYNDDRDVSIYLLDLRLEANPSSSTPNTIWSLYNDQTTSQVSNLGISNSPSFSTANTNITLGGTINDEIYGINYGFIYDNESSQYSINTDNELLALFNLSKIEPMKIVGRQNGFDYIFTDWSAPLPTSQILYEQSTIQFNTDIPDDYTEFTVIYNFTFNFDDNRHYGLIQLGPNFGGVNESWIDFELKDGFLSRASNNESFMFVRYNQSFMGDGFITNFTLNYTIENVPTFDDNYFAIYNEEDLNPIESKGLNGGYPQITFTEAPADGVPFDIIYAIRSLYELGNGFQKNNKPFSDSVRLIQNHDEGSGIDPIMDSTGTFQAVVLESPSLYINLDNSPARTVLELYEIPLLYAPEVNLSFIFDPIIINQIKNLPTEDNSLLINFDYVLTDDGTYFTDSLEINLDYTAITPDLVSDTYTVAYNKDLQGIFDVYGSSSFDLYISISQISNDSYIPYIILEQFDYLCDTHLLEMYSQMPTGDNNKLNVSGVINTPHYNQIFSRPFIDGTQYGDSPFGLIEGAEVTVGIQNLPYSKLVSLQGVAGSLSFSDLGKEETLPINSENFYMIPNLGLFTEGYDIDEPIYQDGFVNLYYGSGTEINGAQRFSNVISMDYEDSTMDDYESWIDIGVPNSWEDNFNITDQFLSTQNIDVSGSVLYHELFDLSTDILTSSELEANLGNIPGAYFAVQLNDSVYPTQVKVIGAPYEYDLSVQGFPVGDYVDGTYCKVITSSRTRNFDDRLGYKIVDSADHSLEFAPDGSAYIVFYQPTSVIQNYAIGSKIMIDYWAYHTFTEGFDYNIIEDPVDHFTSVLDWDYKITSFNSYSMHPDFSIDSTFTIEFAALDWSTIDANYINDAVETFTFRPKTLDNITVFYSGETMESFSIYGIIPEDQFNDTSVYQDIYVQIWKSDNESSIETFKLNEDPIMYGYIYQDSIEYDHYLLNYTKVEGDIQLKKNDISWTLVPDFYVFIEVEFVSELLRYPIAHTPFNYDYLGGGNNAYHITLTIGGGNPIYSYDTVEFNKYVSKIENNYIYFHDKDFVEDGYIVNQSQISLEYKFKLQPGLIDQEHFLMAIYPWSNVFDTILQSSDDSISYRERYRKLSGSSIISPFEYSLSINDTYSLFLSYRLNRREYFEEKFEMDYSTGNLTFNYLQDGLDSYISEMDESTFIVYYYDESGRGIELSDQLYTIDTDLHKLTLIPGRTITIRPGFMRNAGGPYPFYSPPVVRWAPNPIVEVNEITKFYVSFFAQPYDVSFNSHTFTYDINDYRDETSLDVTYWKVIEGEQLDVIPNFEAYYYYEEDNSYNRHISTEYGTYFSTICRATQISAYLEEGTTLSFNLAGELAWYDYDLLQDIRDGDKYLSLYMNTVIENYEALEKILIEMYDGVRPTPNLISSYNISAEELIVSDFTLKIDLPTTSNNLTKIEFTPIFRTDAEYSSDNVIEMNNFDFIEWDSTKTSFNSDGNIVMYHTLEKPLFVDAPNYEIAYLFNKNYEYLGLPAGIEFAWSDETLDGGADMHVIQIPELYIDPDNPSVNSTFKDGDIFMIKYNSPVEKTIQIGIEKLFFRKKPYNHDAFSEVAEILLINANNSLDYSQFTAPYSYNISIPITPFQTEYLGNYRQLTVDVNLTTLSQFAESGYIDFSDLVVSVPNPAYELTIESIGIFQESSTDIPQNDNFLDNIWRKSERELIISGTEPTTDIYQLALDKTPLFYNDLERDKWLGYLTVYDEDGNYYSAGLSGDYYQLIWNPSTESFTWNDAFNQFPTYSFTELPLIIEPETKLYFEYSINSSWSEIFSFDYENIDAGNTQILYDYNYLLKPRYFTLFGNIYENNIYDYELEQFYSESFTVYSNSAEYEHILSVDYDFQEDFTNLSLYKIIGLYPNFTQFSIEDDDINYNVTFNPSAKSITISDLISVDGLLNQFGSITVILNFTFGPVSTLTELSLSDTFNQTFLSDTESTIYGEIYASFNYFDNSKSYLFSEDYSTITSDSSSFSSINFTRNPQLGNSPILKGYNDYELYLNYEIFENQYNTIYEADIEQDGQVDYKQEVDIDKDGRIDVTKYGIQDSENPLEIIWYKIIQDTQSTTRTVMIDYEEMIAETFLIDSDIDDLGIGGDAKISRIIEKQTETELSQFTRDYSIRLDYDLDGYADSQINYIKEENVATTTIEIEMETKVELVDSPQFATYVQRTYLSETTSFLSEELVYYDLKEGEILETRHYTNAFVDDNSLFNAEEDINTLSIIDQNTGEQMEVNANNLMFNTSQVAWNIDTWGSDNVPVKFESIKITSQNGEETFSNIHEETITIRMYGRYSLYYDLLKDSVPQIFPQQFPSTEFVVTGPLITPSDGVYFTSDKNAFFDSSTHEGAKLKDGAGNGIGHYLYYDSDLNDFYETVFILYPDDDDDGVYDVIGIGYNYDGSHDFIPYDTILATNQKYGTIEMSGSTSTIILYSSTDTDKFGNSQVLKFDFKKTIDKLYPYDFSDGSAPKDHIFDISKLTTARAAEAIYPELYYETKEKQFAKAYQSYDNNLWKDVKNEVIKAGTSGFISSTIAIAAGSLWMAPFVFAALYFTFSWYEKEIAKFDAEQHLKARTFWPRTAWDPHLYRDPITGVVIGETPERPSNPDSLNEMRDIDVRREGLVAVANNHKGAYYSNVFGGEMHNQYTADIITSPPGIWRATVPEGEDSGEVTPEKIPWWGWFSPLYQLTWLINLQDTLNHDYGPVFTNFNLDYFLITSELPALEEILNLKYPSTNKLFSVELNYASSDREDLHNAYKEYTISYLEQEVEAKSNGELDSIRPLVINGVPQYVFVDSKDEAISRTRPLSPMYTAIVVGQSRYEELVKQGYSNSTITIFTDCAYGFANDAFNAYQLQPSEAQLYQAKIPLSPSDFNYPISIITIDLLGASGDVIKTVEVDPSNFTVVDGNLYFTQTLEEIVFSSKVEWETYALKSEEYYDYHNRPKTRILKIDLDYNIHVVFATIVPYDDGRPDTLSEGIYENTGLSGPLMTFLYSILDVIHPGIPDVIDTTSSDLARTALAQSTSYAISDYFNQVQMGYTDGTNKATRDYTVLVTFWSTLISNLIMLPITVYTMGTHSALSFKQSLALALGAIPASVTTEIYEELYLDPYIEIWVERFVKSLGGDAEAAEMASLLVTSFREAFIGGVSGTITGGLKHAFNFNKDQSLDTKLGLWQMFTKIDSETSWKSVVNLDNVLNILAAIPSFFLGGADIGILAIGLDLSTEMVQAKLKRHYMKGKLTSTIQRNIDREIEQTLSEMKPAIVIDTSPLNLDYRKKINFRTIAPIMPASAMMSASAMTMEFGDRDMRLAAEGFILREKLKIKALDDLLMGKIEGDFWTYKQNNEFDSYERQRIKEGLKSLENELFEGQSILDGEGTAMAVKMEILKIIIAKKTTPGSVLTELENRILNTAWLNLDGKTPLYTNIQDGKINPFLPLFENFIGRVMDKLIKVGVLTSKSTDVLDVIVQVGYNDGGVGISKKIERMEEGINLQFVDLIRWQARIEYAIESQSEISNIAKERAIESIGTMFNNYYRISGFSKNPLYHSAVINLRKIADILYQADFTTRSSLTGFLTYIGRPRGTFQVLGKNSDKVPSLTVLRGLGKDLTTAISKDSRFSDLKKEKIQLACLSYIESSIWQVEQYNMLNSKLINTINIYPDNIKKDLILDIISTNKPFLEFLSSENWDITQLSRLLFRSHSVNQLRNFLRIDKRVIKDSIGTLDNLVAMLFSVSSWTASDFDFNLNKDQLMELKMSVSEKLNGYIKDNLLNMGDGKENFYKLYGKNFLYDKLEVIKAFWFALAHSMEDGSLTLNQIYKRYKGEDYSPGNLFVKMVGAEYKSELGIQTISNLLIIINYLADVEMLKARTGDIAYDKIFAIDNALRTILEYAGIYHMGKSRTQVKTTITQDLLIELRNLPKRSSYYSGGLVRPVLDTNGLNVAYHSLPSDKLFNRLLIIDDIKGFPRWIDHSSAVPIEKNFNKKLKGLNPDSRRTLSQKLLNTVVTQYSKGDGNILPNSIFDSLLFSAAIVKKMADEGKITNEERHKILVDMMSMNEPGFIGGEIPVWIPMQNMYTGKIDVLLFDPESRTLYVIDYKPDLTYNSFEADGFVVSIPQLAAYGLTMEEIADINVQCIMFNDQAAWVFSPNEVLAPIEAFMLAVDGSWVAPWQEFLDLVEYKELFWAQYLYRRFPA